MIVSFTSSAGDVRARHFAIPDDRVTEVLDLCRSIASDSGTRGVIVLTLELAHPAAREPLDRVSSTPIGAIKELRAVFGVNLKEARNWLVNAPVALPPLPEDKAADLYHALREVGCKVGGFDVFDRLTSIVRTS